MIQPPPNPPSSDKTLLHLWNKSFLTEIYRNIKTLAIKVLQECGLLGVKKWCSANVFFWHQTETCVLEYLQSQKGFWLYCCIVNKWSFSLVFLAWRILGNLKIKKKLWWFPLERVDEHENAVCPKIYFLKKNAEYEILNHWIIYILVQVSLLGTALGGFSQCVFFVGQTSWPKFLLTTKRDSSNGQ